MGVSFHFSRICRGGGRFCAYRSSLHYRFGRDPESCKFAPKVHRQYSRTLGSDPESPSGSDECRYSKRGRVDRRTKQEQFPEPNVALPIRTRFFPLALSVAISTSWKEPSLTVLLYVSLELFTNNVIEPIVLGGSTGVSSLAVIVSALFWTWLWGPVGLLLATPLTACLVVLGLYFPAFHFWSVLLASDPPTTAEANLIRLLTESRLPEAKALVHESTGMILSAATAENLVVPTIRMIENGRFPGSSAAESKRQIYEQMREIIDELKIERDEAVEQKPDSCKVFIVPFTAEGDELVGWILTRLLEVEGVTAEVLSWRALRSEKVEELREMQPRWILLSAIEARSALAVGKMAHSIKMVLPETVILIGLWSLPPQGGARVIRRITESSVGGVYTSMEEAVRGIASLVATVSEETPSEMPDDGGSV